MKNYSKQLLAIKEYVSTLFADDVTGHDYFHMQRVAKLARFIAKKEGADLFICEAAAFLHDVGDPKLCTDRSHALDNMNLFLERIEISRKDISHINHIIDHVSYSKKLIPSTMEGKIVQDADRLDALGAIGIARAFAFGGASGQMIYHDHQVRHTSIQHFYDKLLKLKRMMNTKTAAAIAKERHSYMEDYVNRFFDEWRGTTFSDEMNDNFDLC